MNIKVLGSGCKKCTNLYDVVDEVVKEMNIPCTLEKVTDMKSIMSYGVMSTPALVINEKVVSYGKIPSKAEITQYINNA